MKVFIGVGHGGTDPGAVANGFMEKDLNLDMALMLKLELEKYGITVVISRTSDISHNAAHRIRMANSSGADIAVDLHVNAGAGRGFEAYVPLYRDAAQSRNLAKRIEEEIKGIGHLSRGIKTRKDEFGYDHFGFLRSINCPRVILECAFIDSLDINKINTPQKRMVIVKAYARGIIRYIGNGCAAMSDAA